jgi:diguanylate cyclase (GGDEF)-like protein
MIEPIIEKPHILIIDDEPLIRDLLCEMLAEDFVCSTAACAEDALALLKQNQFSLVLSDIHMGEMSGIEMIPLVRAAAPDTVVVMISSEQSIDSAINAMRVGAFDYIKKPFNIIHVRTVVEHALEHHSLLAAKRRYENHLEELVEKRTAELNFLAYHDALTTLPNRVLFEDRLSQALTLTENNQQILAVFLLSLDRFKKVHDTLGRESEAKLLKEVAERLQSCVPGGATTARFEKDEFGLLLPQIGNTRDILKIINKINKSLNRLFVIETDEIFITASIGISLFPNDGRDVQTLIRNASAALDRARESGGNNYQFYTAEMNAKAVKRLALENNLRRALEREEFEVYYQPKIDVKTGQIVGMEALVRWKNPKLGLVSPTEFIPLAEETGLIVPIGEWVLRAACAQARAWQDEGFAPLYISVNLSPRQFQQPDLLEAIGGIIRDTGIDPNYLELEVTEGSLMHNTEDAVETLRELKKLGVKISIDDFGTGYSSLGYLKRLPLDVLKIDKSFMEDVTANPEDAAIVMTIISLAHNLNLKVIAEGVELEEQLKFLQLLKCDQWQGYLYSKPVSAEAFRELLLQSSRLISEATG